MLIAYERSNTASACRLCLVSQKGIRCRLHGTDTPVFNGDTNDLRFLDPKGAIIGLYAKGKAKKDCTGFTVRDLHPHLIQIGA